MKCKELGDSIGVHHLQVGKARKKLFPDSTGEITVEEQGAIKEFLSVETKPKLIKVKVVFYDSRFPEWIDAVESESKKNVLVQLPYGYKAESFIGREIYVYERKVSDERSIYQYDPWTDG